MLRVQNCSDSASRPSKDHDGRAQTFIDTSACIACVDNGQPTNRLLSSKVYMFRKVMILLFFTAPTMYVRMVPLLHTATVSWCVLPDDGGSDAVHLVRLHPAARLFWTLRQSQLSVSSPLAGAGAVAAEQMLLSSAHEASIDWRL